MRYAMFAASLLLMAGCRSEPVPENTLLWRVHEWKPAEGGVRVSTATILTFRSSGEYVELHTRIIEQRDETVYVASDAPRLTIVGAWTRDGDTITATRERVLRPAAHRGPRDPLCDERLTFRLEGRSVRGRVIDSEGLYSPVTRLVAPEFESYAEDARERGAQCSPGEA